MRGITEGLTSDSLVLRFQPSHCRTCLIPGGDKGQNFLDMRDIPDLHSTHSFSSTSSSSPASPDSNRHPLAHGARGWLVGEKTTRQILSVVQPTIDSESRRKEVTEYLQRLIEDAFGIKVFPFGSVPFKTYLPHGDVDLTAVHYYGTSGDLASDICTLLINEEKNNSNISVRDVLCVPAQVRVVKCTVSGIAVDISFNQTAGLCALYFLEQVDQFIRKNHLFKLSVILIKSWCYYESRILGGFHGLISTYALETMILHVINLFHASLHCPLAVLYKFLEYYGAFDWKKYCIGINGLVLKSSLPEIEVVSLHNSDELLLTEEFLRSSRETLLPWMGDVGNNRSDFPVKFMNILDPLRDDNNLGRSVSRGNFYRIKSALSYGAGKLSDILMLPPEKIGVGLENFFINTLEMNGNGDRADVLVPVRPYGPESHSLGNDNNSILAGIQYGLWFDDYDMTCPMPPATSQGSNNGWGEVQYDYNAFYDMEESSPSSIGSPRGQRLNNIASNGEKWKPGRTASLGDNSRTFQINNGASYDDKWQSKGYYSSVDGHNGFHLNNGVSFGEKRKSRGTCAYIPHFEHFMQNGVDWDYAKGEEYIKEADKLASHARTSRDVNYSMDEFPLLPGSKPIPIRASPLPFNDREQNIHTPVSLDSSESLSEVGKQTDSDGSIFPDDDKDLPKNDEHIVVTVEPLQLTDECEFPPLGRPEKPVVTFCKKEFPPLRACRKPKIKKQV